MKRKIFAVLAIGTIAIASCKKVEPTPATAPGTATAEGTLWADLDIANDTDAFGWYQWNPETAPSGIRVTAIVDSYDLDQTPDPSYDYQDLKYYATTDASGKYSIANIPCFNMPINVELMFNDFTADQKQSGTTTVSTNFSLGSAWITVYDGAVVINDFNY